MVKTIFRCSKKDNSVDHLKHPVIRIGDPSALFEIKAYLKLKKQLSMALNRMNILRYFSNHDNS